MNNLIQTKEIKKMDRKTRKTSLSNKLYLVAEELEYEIGYWSQVSSEEEKAIVENIKKLLRDIMEIQKTL